MRLTAEAHLVQNPAVGALALWGFVDEYAAKSQTGCPILFCLPVLPIALNRDASATLHSRRFEGGLELALAEHREIAAGLQDRMEQMVLQTMHAIDLAFATRLMTYDSDSGHLSPLRHTRAFRTRVPDIRQIMNTSRRLGYWFAAMPTRRIISLLNIRL